MLIIQKRYINETLYVKLKGILTKDTVYKFNESVTNMAQKSKINNIILNLSNLNYIDLKGINALFYNYELCKSNKGAVFIYGNNDNIKNKLKKTRLLNYIHEIPLELMVI